MNLDPYYPAHVEKQIFINSATFSSASLILKSTYIFTKTIHVIPIYQYFHTYNSCLPIFYLYFTSNLFIYREQTSRQKIILGTVLSRRGHTYFHP